MSKTFIIAEAGVNHNGSLKMAKELVDVCVESKADAIKFQTFHAEDVVTRDAPKANYQKQSTGANETQFDMIKKLELDHSAFLELSAYSRSCGMRFLSTPFDIGSVDFLNDEVKVDLIKIASGEITNAPLLLRIAQKKKPVILSTGMSSLGDIEMALGILAFGYLNSDEKPSLNNFSRSYLTSEGQEIIKKNVTLLHCTTAYPAPFNNVNLRAMDTLRSAFNLPVGLSDHTDGIAVPLAAVARGATVIEKHFTLDQNLPGPDHRASLNPKELSQMILGIRAVEKSLGDSRKMISSCEVENKPIARRSLVAAKAVREGELFTEVNLTVKRPGNGRSPIYYYDWLGQAASRSYQEGEEIV